MISAARSGRNSNTLSRCRDTDPPRKPKLHKAFAFKKKNEIGAYIELDQVGPKTEIQIINRSLHPSTRWKRDGELPANAFQVPLSGYSTPQRGSLIFTQEDMENHGIRPGDVLEMRLIDKASNTSKPIEAKICTELDEVNFNGKNTFEVSPTSFSGVLGGTFGREFSATYLAPGNRIGVKRYPYQGILASYMHRFIVGFNKSEKESISLGRKVRDTDAPVVSGKPKIVQGGLSYQRKFESGASARVTNLSTGQQSHIDETLKAVIDFNNGDVLESRVYDTAGNSNIQYYEVCNGRLYKTDLEM